MYNQQCIAEPPTLGMLGMGVSLTAGPEGYLNRSSGLSAILLRAVHDDLTDQVQRQGFLQGELDRALSLLVGSQFLLEGFAAGGDRIEPDVVSERGELWAFDS